jgi:type IV secretory pathway VirB4 component
MTRSLLARRKDRRAAWLAPEAGLTPAVVQVARGHVRAGDGYAATFAVTGYPATVGPAWLEPLLSYPGRVDVALHIDPVPAELAAPMLRRQRARLESTRRLDADAGRLADPLTDAAADDAADLAERVARGAARLFRVGVYVTVHAPTLDELARVCAGVRAAAAGVLLDLQPATFRHHHGHTTTLPLGVDRLGMRRVLDTAALAAAFPFSGPGLPAPVPGEPPARSSAVLYGVNTTGTGVLVWDRWNCENHNAVVLARSGAGKSYFVKLDVLRNLYQGVQVAVIDPDDEYADLAGHVGGAVVRLGAPGVRVNPLDLPASDRRPDALTRRGLFLHTLLAVMLGDLTPGERAVLDAAITATYATAGITHDPTSWTRPAPLLADLAAALSGHPDPTGRQLAARLHPWTVGSFADLFNGPTATSPVTAGPGTGDSPGSEAEPGSGVGLTVWSLRHLPDQTRPAAMLLALDTIWRDTDTVATASSTADGSPVRRLVVVDEAWQLLCDGEGARFLFRMAKAARKRCAGLTVVTQDAADVLGTDLGLAVVSNAATQILMRQAPQAIDAVTAAFGLTAGEARLLLHAPQGEGLLVAGHARIPFRAVASPAEAGACQTGIRTATGTGTRSPA